MSKILILSGSPQRDKLIDELLKKELDSLGNEVVIRQTPLGARESVIELKPDILLIPPICNIYSYDTACEAARWGISVVVRHVEPGYDRQDMDSMGAEWRSQELFTRPENLAMELTWGNVESDYIRKFSRGAYPVMPVGAFVSDLYTAEYLSTPDKEEDIVNKHGLDPSKKTILVSSPWGLLDMDSDLAGQSSDVLMGDEEAMDKWLKMVGKLKTELTEFNILATLHPGLLKRKEYEILGPMGIPVDTDSTAVHLLSRCDILIHAGSTMAIEMHWLGKPSFQFGDVNSLDMIDGNWWQRAGTPISKVSPFCMDAKELAVSIRACKPESNADIDTIKDLEQGRYGNMDGNAARRAAVLINELSGKCEIKWPMSQKAIDTQHVMKDFKEYYSTVVCSVCDEPFWMTNQNILKIHKDMPPPPTRFFCPVCGAALANRMISNKPI